MTPKLLTPTRPSTGRRRGRPPGTTNAFRAARQAALGLAGEESTAASEPPPKKRRYVPGGAGGGGRFVDADAPDTPMPTTASPSVYPRRAPSTRTRNPPNRDDNGEMRYSSAAAVAAAVVQSEGYKPREERSWEEFHPNLDIDATLMVFSAEDVDGTAKSIPGTPAIQTPGTPINGSDTPSRDIQSVSTGNTPNPTLNPTSSPAAALHPGTPTRRRVSRQIREPVSYYSARSVEVAQTPRTPHVLPIQSQNPKERLELKQPSYRKTDRILLFESKTFGQARYVDKAMANVGYQESDIFIRPDLTLIKSTDANVEEEVEPVPAAKTDRNDNGQHHHSLARVEYDMDEQDDMWLETINAERKATDLEPITREVFEITITKIEKEWHALEKRIPKPNPKPPQTHRPRSSSAAAVNGEPQAGEEQDSKCAICDDGDCENTNAIVFCDGCDLAVHQECYGVPFIPEGQWLCRKCQLIGRGIPTCIFCPNTDGAFKQTNSSKWAHLLCAMWIPEVSLGNHTFMEPVMDVEKVPKNRWKLSCYICNQKMGACIQCGNKSCYQAFHVTCARRAKLFLKMKNSQGALAVLDGNMILKAFCDKHCPPDYSKENGVHQAARAAKKFYKRTMKGRIWADNHAAANAIAATHRHAITEHPPDESQMTGAKLSAVLGDKRKGQPGKPIWKLPSGAPVIPQAVYDIVEASVARFNIRKRREFVAEACRYWTLKREARRGAALLKRLQLQMETFSSMELTRRNFATMGPSGKARLTRRIRFAETLLSDLDHLKNISDHLVQREWEKLEAAELEQAFVDICYFPISKLLSPVLDKAFTLDKNVFESGLARLQTRLDARFYTTSLAFAQDLGDVIYEGINTEQKPPPADEAADPSPAKNNYTDARGRKTLGKRILRAVQPQLEAALRIESSITHRLLDESIKELERILEASVELRQPSITALQIDTTVGQDRDIDMTDASAQQITVAGKLSNEHEDSDGVDDENADVDASIEVNTSGLEALNGVGRTQSSLSEREEMGKADKPDTPMTNGIQDSVTPPATNGYVPMVPSSQPAPPTPPQSNGGLGKEANDLLAEGGIPWYLKAFTPRGTTATEPEWAGRDAVRSLSEDLTDIDDDELKGLGLDVDADTITASPNGAEVVGDTIVSAAKTRVNNRTKKRARTSGRRR